jgi:hypothetical protein
VHGEFDDVAGSRRAHIKPGRCVYDLCERDLMGKLEQMKAAKTYDGIVTIKLSFLSRQLDFRYALAVANVLEVNTVTAKPQLTLLR